PWANVIEWLVEQTGLPYVGIKPPTGTFNYVAPKDQKVTICQAIDLINDGLLISKNAYLIVRRETSLTLLPADAKPDPKDIPRVSLEELQTRGKTELVQILLVVNGLIVEDYAGEIKKLMGPFSEIVPLKISNQLVLVDTAANLRRVVNDIENMEKNAA